MFRIHLKEKALNSCFFIYSRHTSLRNTSVLQPGSDPCVVRDQHAAVRRARRATRVQEQLPPAQPPPQHGHAAAQLSHRRGGRLQSADGYSVGAVHDLLAASNGKSIEQCNRTFTLNH